MPASTPLEDHDLRGQPRTSLYLAAVLYCDGSSSVVKIRNISPDGALLEADLLPPAGSLVQLMRGGLIAHALVKWNETNRCGLNFSGAVDVQRWRTTNLEQQRVDEVVRLLKAGAVPLPVAPPARTHGDPGPVLASDIRRVSEILANVGGDLAGDPLILEKYGAMLQHFDIAAQLLSGMEATLVGHSESDASASKLAALRSAADQALQRTALARLSPKFAN